MNVAVVLGHQVKREMRDRLGGVAHFIMDRADASDLVFADVTPDPGFIAGHILFSSLWLEAVG
jgi:hypothetical protein